ncbi:hypothetical protein BDQ17DRAFT_1342173 [Cyathus striatus]|nr:hypothetical protein BDQ17DRAFT_1342173 [Cyathus striatus]
MLSARISMCSRIVLCWLTGTFPATLVATRPAVVPLRGSRLLFLRPLLTAALRYPKALCGPAAFLAAFVIRKASRNFCWFTRSLVQGLLRLILTPGIKAFPVTFIATRPAVVPLRGSRLLFLRPLLIAALRNLNNLSRYSQQNSYAPDGRSTMWTGPAAFFATCARPDGTLVGLFVALFNVCFALFWPQESRTFPATLVATRPAGVLRISSSWMLSSRLFVILVVMRILT